MISIRRWPPCIACGLPLPRCALYIFHIFYVFVFFPLYSLFCFWILSQFTIALFTFPYSFSVILFFHSRLQLVLPFSSFFIFPSVYPFNFFFNPSSLSSPNHTFSILSSSLQSSLHLLLALLLPLTLPLPLPLLHKPRCSQYQPDAVLQCAKMRPHYSSSPSLPRSHSQEGRERKRGRILFLFSYYLRHFLIFFLLPHSFSSPRLIFLPLTSLLSSVLIYPFAAFYFAFLLQLL